MSTTIGVLFLIAAIAFLYSGCSLAARVVGGWLGRYGAEDDEGYATDQERATEQMRRAQRP